MKQIEKEKKKRKKIRVTVNEINNGVIYYIFITFFQYSKHKITKKIYSKL